ncbi:MAG: hypothetical protein A2X94_15930 [Bdellovibrionales bacterium GWB1_55_8]|nr:MAG: hypothetical protein A2X94_15930 [Bdellovibrionales bacterium GWB1_55_8]
MARTNPSTEVAQEALSYCTSCKMDLNHVIVAMKGDRIAKVQCLTCKKEHVYRAPKGATEPVKKKSKKETAAAEAAISSIEAEWTKLMTAHKDAPMKPYSMKASFALGDKLKHPTFGDGIVGKLIYPNKLEVIFSNNIKVLIHAGVTNQ